MRRSVATSFTRRSGCHTLGAFDVHFWHPTVTETPTPDGPPSQEGDDRASQGKPASQGDRAPKRETSQVSTPQSRMAIYRYAALGTELAAYSLMFAGIGYAIDWARGHEKLYATAAGTAVGFAYGMFRFVSQVQGGPK